MSWLAVALLVTVGVLSPEQTRRLVERYNKAQAAVGAHDYEQASKLLGSLVRDFGSSEFGNELEYALAECYFNMGQYSRAYESFTKLLARPQYSYIKPEAMYGAAVSAIMLGSFREAQDLLEKLSKEQGYDRDERTSFALGVLYYFQKSYEQAIVRLTGLEMPEAKFYLAKSYALTGKPMPALVKFKEVTAEVPNTPLATMAHFAAGQALFINRDYDGARAKFEQFVDNFPYSNLADFASYFLGCALLAQKQYAAAVDRFMPLTRHSNNLLAAHANYWVGYADLALGKAQNAVERFQRVRANYPKTKVSSYANLQLSQAMLATADTIQTLLATSQLATMFKSGDLAGVGNYLSGVISYQVREYDKAAQQFETVLVNYANTALREPACAMLLLALASSGQYEKSAAIGAKYVADFPEDTTHWRAKTLYFLAEGLYYGRKYSDADAYYQQAYSQFASSDIAPYARLGRAYCLYHNGRLTEAVAGFKALLNARVTDTLFTISAYLGYGYALFNQKEYLKALDVFEALTNTFPDRDFAAIPGYFYAGYCYYQMKYYGQAVDAWTALINKFPSNNSKAAEAAFRSGDTYFKALEYDKAIANFTFVIERYPFSDFGPPSQALIAQCYYNRKQFLDAVREYQKFIDLYPSDPQVPSVRKSLEASYYFAGQEDSTVMDDFLRRFPQSEMAAEGQYERGRKLYDAGDYEQAVVELQKAVVNFPGSPIAGDAQLLTAEAYAQLKRWPEAAQAYERFLAYFPNHEQRAGATFNLATAYFNAGSYQQSLKWFQTVTDSFPDSEFAESARKNVEVSRKRLGAGEGAGPETTGDAVSGERTPTEGEKQQ
ncbi:MAG: tetratricopeptide repeat protein [candidate division WOR-3 bacterium]